ncbi:MAG: guanylate kinase [Oscillospiraceae bacterium]
MRDFKKQGVLTLLIGPSGSGKGTVLKEVLKNDNNIFLSISATTRSPRNGEVDGENYYFITKNEFEDKIKSGSMLEYASYCDNFYGTPKDAVLNKLSNGQNVILEIEMQGAIQIKKMYKNAIMIFIIPPSMQILRERLSHRGTEDVETINKRMETAKNEISFAYECDYIVINDELEIAVNQVKSIIAANQCSLNSMKPFMKEEFILCINHH